MKQTWLSMGMPISLQIDDHDASDSAFAKIREYFERIDNQFSPYKPDSEVSRINDGLAEAEWSDEMRLIMRLAEQTKKQTNGYFDVYHKGSFDPSGIVKGWAINEAAKILKDMGAKQFYLDVGGDIQVAGKPWRVGIRNPFNRYEIVKTITVQNEGVATSGTYIRGQHIYDPHTGSTDLQEVASISVIGPDIYEADRYATAAFAMGVQGINFIEALDGFEAYMIMPDKQATMTTGFNKYVGAKA